MTRLPVDLKPLLPIDREIAMRLADAASRHACVLTLEASGAVLNLKSMLGLFSQAIPADGRMMLCANGDGEERAAAEMAGMIRALSRRR